MKKSVLSAAILSAVLVGMPAVSSAAALVNGLFSPGVVNQIQDTDAERVLRGANVVTSGAFQVGDIIESVLRFDTVNTAAISDSIPSPYKLGAYSQLKIASLIGTGTFIGGQELYTIVFAPTGNLGANVMGSLYEINTLSPSWSFSTNSPATLISNVTSGSHIADVGFGQASDFWYATALNDIGVVATATSGSSQQANGVFGLSFISNPGGIPYATNGMTSGAVGPYFGTKHDVVGSSSIYARSTGTNNGWLVNSNTEINFFTVPEPGSVALSGLALLGMFAVAKRRKS